MRPAAIDYRAGDARPQRRLPGIVVWPARVAPLAYALGIVVVLYLSEYRLMPRHLFCCQHPQATVAVGFVASIVSVAAWSLDAFSDRGWRQRFDVVAAVLAMLAGPLGYGFVKVMQA